MWICVALIALGVVALGFYIVEKCKRYSLRGVFIKTIVSLFFVGVAAIASSQKQGHAFNAFIILGLIFGLLGDIWLDLKYVYPNDQKAYTYAGFIVFLIGHIFFVTGMMLEFFADGNYLFFLIPIGAATVFCIANLLLEKPLKLDFGSMRWICTLYAFCLAMTPGTALLCCIHTGWQLATPIMMFAGGILFAISDLVLSGTYFGEGKERPIDFILNYITYYGAQFTIAFSIMFL